jgi:hypothetical protein
MRIVPTNLFASFCLSIALLFSAVPAHAITPKEAALHTIGRKTILAIANGDAAYISSITDPHGIYVGYDGVKHSAESFRDDLAKHIGLYCELFDKGCRTNHNPAYTLAHSFTSALSPNPLNADLKYKINKDNGSLDYVEPVGGDGIATLSYRYAGGKWYLYNIYFV